ncbi:sodium:proton antiporter [Pseudomonas sp. OIL-1]|uniref:sodium:proton antiporter n=1 Tax=Pseudomonas sp. OIL-1 TaxID=2706126 RepID=UPI0013A74784|nr:sodium:proton antiporter [Pseudomonas sp. OIL-1]QIB52846.1 Na+/H+ antiporter subunit C [Pseudomonas sp. OIL-1]
MEWLTAVTAGVMAGLGIWMMLDQHLIRVVLGIAVFSNAINLGVLAAGRHAGDAPAFVTQGAKAALVNPLPQALVLTAIVIGFALFVFALSILKRTYELHGKNETDDVTVVVEQPAPDGQENGFEEGGESATGEPDPPAGERE